MPFTHYPKLSGNVVFAYVQPQPPDRPGFLGQPSFHSINGFENPLQPGEAVAGYLEAQPFTRFYGSIFCDQPLEVTFSFSNDECGPDGHWVNDDNLSLLHYDAEALKQLYSPDKHTQCSKYFVTIFGRWLKVSIKNTGTKPTEQTRIYVRGSVF